MGSEKWSAGFAHVLFDATSKVIQYGYLLTWQASFAGDSSAPDVNEGAFQPFVFYQFGGGLYARSTGIMVYDFESDDYTVHLGLGLGKVFPTKEIVYNLYVEPQYSVLDRGSSFPQWQIFAGFNLQFLPVPVWSGSAIAISIFAEKFGFYCRRIRFRNHYPS